MIIIEVLSIPCVYLFVGTIRALYCVDLVRRAMFR